MPVSSSSLPSFSSVPSGASVFTEKGKQDFYGAGAVLVTQSTKDFGGDFLLPDYLPDAKKILRTDVSPCLRGRFLGDGILEYDGTLTCKVLYCDDGSRLRAAHFDLPFEGRIEDRKLSSDCVELLIPYTEGMLCRMQGPRKLSLKGKVGVNAAFFRRESTLPTLPNGVSPKSISSLETKLSPVPGMNLTTDLETDLTFTETLFLEKNLPQIDGIVTYSLLPLPEDCRPSPEGLRVRGRIEVECLYYTELHSSGDDGESKEIYTTFRQSVPFSETLAAFTQPTGSSQTYRCGAFASVQSASVTPCEDENGQNRGLSVELVYTLDARCVSDTVVQTVVDAYSRREDCVLTEQERQIPRYGGCFSGSFTTSETIPWKQLQGEINEILSLQITPSFSPKPTVSRRGTALLEGNADLTIGGKDKDGTPLLLHAVIPLRCETDLPYEKDTLTEESECLLHLSASCAAPRARIEREGIALDFETLLTAWLLHLCPHRCVKEIALSGETTVAAEAGNAGDVRLFYPQKGETLWDAAKRYRVTKEALAFENNLSGEEESLPRVLLIPQNKR